MERSTGRQTAKLGPPRRESQPAELRSLRLTGCLVALLGAQLCLVPYLSLQLRHRVGLLLFESDLVQLRASLLTVILNAGILVILFAGLKRMQAAPARPEASHIAPETASRTPGATASSKRPVQAARERAGASSSALQLALHRLLAWFAIISAILYLALGVWVPPIRQMQRLPVASFDCHANLITIENCQQQFSSRAPEQSLVEALALLLLGLQSAGQPEQAGQDRLSRRLGCLRYQSGGRRSEEPSRFLLHQCGLVCRPNRQQLHQFSDDLNQDQGFFSESSSPWQPHNTAAESSHEQPKSLLEQEAAKQMAQQPNSSHQKRLGCPSGADCAAHRQVSLRICFSGELQGPANYKRLCITNLAGSHLNRQLGGSQHQQMLTVGQLNVMLRNRNPRQESQAMKPASEQVVGPIGEREAGVADQATQYVNPVVQFESHLSQWPQYGSPDLPSSNEEPSGQEEDLGDDWCMFRPIPPFLVADRPFSEIQCSLEQEYTLTSLSLADKIYLRRASQQAGPNESSSSSLNRVERCSIQCKLSLLYQARLAASTNQMPVGHYYLPLRPCLVLLGSGDKSVTIGRYLILRTLADSCLLLVLVLLDLELLLEALDTRQSALESNRFRLICLLLCLLLVPLFMAYLFQLFNEPNLSWLSRQVRSLYEQLARNLGEFVSKLAKQQPQQQQKPPPPPGHTGEESLQGLDGHLVSLFAFACFMFGLATQALLLPLLPAPTSLLRSTSVEQLGLVGKQAPAIASNTKNPISKLSSNKVQSDNNMSQQRTASFGLKEDITETLRTSRILSWVPLSSFGAAALFMGVQFNLAQLGQNQFLMDSFAGPGGWIQLDTVGISSQPGGSQQRASHQPEASPWIALIASSALPAFLVLVLVLLLSNEASSFLARFNPFKLALYQDHSRKGRTSFRKHLAMASLLYSLRALTLINLGPISSLAGLMGANSFWFARIHRFRWLLVLLFQLAELLNFPVLWLALSARLHELLLECQIRPQRRTGEQQHRLEQAASVRPGDASPAKTNNQPNHLQQTSLDLHLVGQASLALTYFGLGRSVSLFAHSLQASLHLHSDNLNWFIDTFYRPQLASSNASHASAGESATRPSASQTAREEPHLSGSHSSSVLFSPLPAERQTYAHAWSLLLKYNAGLCLLVFLILLALIAFDKYQDWARHRRTLDLSRAARNGLGRWPSSGRLEPQLSPEDFRCLDERLGMDLLKLGLPKRKKDERQRTRIVQPRPAQRDRRSKLRHAGPRARILFHYDLGRHDSSDLSSSEPSSAPLPAAHLPQPSSSASSGAPADSIPNLQEVKIPIALAREDEDLLREKPMADEQQWTRGAERVEHIVKRVRKKIRIVDEEEVEKSAGADSPAKMAARKSRFSGGQLSDEDCVASYDWARKPDRNTWSARRSGRGVSFAPTTILIPAETSRSSSDEQARGRAQIEPTSRQPRHASPEPSIGEPGEEDEDGLDDGEHDSNEQDSIGAGATYRGL